MKTIKTPERLAKFMWESFSGAREIPSKVSTFKNPAKNGDMVIVKNIPFYSFCAHHLLPFFGEASIGYIPDKKIAGFSSIGRVISYYAKMPQLQEQLSETLNINNSKDEVINTLWDKHRKGVNLSIFSDAVEVLNNLFNKGFKLGIISNWDDTLYYMLEKFYIKDFFENVVVSSEIGYEKPDLRIFRYAIDKSALNPENICYVGDDYDKDFLPSNKLGMHSIYLCHKEVYPFAACDSKHPRNLKDVEKIIQLNG